MTGYTAIGNVDMRNLGRELRQRVKARKGDFLWVATVPNGYEVRDPTGVVATLTEQGFKLSSNSYNGLHSDLERAYVHYKR